MAGTLTTSPALLEAYLSAAGNISRLAMGTETAPTSAVFDAPHDTSQNEYVEGLPFGTRGGMLIEHEFPADGEYTFTVKGMTGYFTAVLGNVKGEKLEVTVDGRGGAPVRLGQRTSPPPRGEGGKTPAIALKAGFHPRRVAFLATSDLPDTGLDKSFQRTMNSPGFDRRLHVLSARGPGVHRRSVQGHGGHRYAEPAPDPLSALRAQRRRGSGLRAQDHHHADHERRFAGRPPRPISR